MLAKFQNRVTFTTLVIKIPYSLLCSDISGGKPLEVEMSGIEYMNDDPGMVDVLYAKVHMKDGSNRYVPVHAFLSVKK